MVNFLRLKIASIFLILVVSFFAIAPSLGLINGKKINLGLDLQGGSSITFQVDHLNYLNDLLLGFGNNLKIDKDLLYFGIKNLELDEFSGVLKIYLDNPELIKNWQEKPPEISFSIDKDLVSAYYSAEYIKYIKKYLLEESITNLRKRIDEFGVRESSIYSLGDNKVVVELPGVENPEELKSLIGKTAKLSFHFIAARKEFDRVTLKDSYGNSYKVQKNPLMTGNLLTNATTGFDRAGNPSVHFKFNAEGAKKFGKITKSNIGKAIAVVLDDKVLTAPTIKDAILTGQGEISGRFTMQEAQNLAALLKSGALPAKLNVIEQKTIGPTLGLESIKTGKLASVVSVLLVSLTMIVVYMFYGLIASASLVINICILFAAIATLNVTLTLPGIAGLVLTIGMAVDANVLIFERMREELSSGTPIKRAIEKAFAFTKTTILDSNLTTLFAAFMILVVGSGPIKGFAVALSLGVLSSMFVALFATRALIDIFALHSLRSSK